MVTLNPNSLKQWQSENLEHIRYEYPLLPTDTVLDIGSYRREFADEIIKRYGCTVECFDALDNRAAWIKDGEIELGGAYYYSSAYADGPRSIYKCVDIAPFLNKEIALCKINIEGMEYDLLKYIYYSTGFKTIKNIQIQFHQVEQFDYKNSYEAIAHKLSYTHELTWRYPFCWENWQRKETI